MRILALDLGKNKSVACVFEAETGEHVFQTVPTARPPLFWLLETQRPDRVVIEISPLAGWVGDLVRSAGCELQVANVNHDAWRWQNVKRKTDRLDALKLAQLSAMNPLGLVHLPAQGVREWRSLLEYRQSLVARRTAVKNRIRAILDREGVSGSPAGKSGWTQTAVARLQGLACSWEEVKGGDFWRGELWEELGQLDGLEAVIGRVEKKLDAVSASDGRVKLLYSVPGIGKRLAEMIVATIDDPHRFRNGKQVGAYVGLTPRQYQSGAMDRQGRISGQGNRALRSMLVEVSWLGLRWNRWMREVYERVHRGSPSRKKIAIVAVARRLMVRCWAMLRDETVWRDPPASGQERAVSAPRAGGDAPHARSCPLAV